MSRIGTRFGQLRTKGHRGLVAYVTAGDPSPERTPEIVWALERGGADVIELGVPFSDPIADGPVIQRASDRALRAGMTLRAVLEIARRVREKSEIPIVLFSYLNPLLRYGFDALACDSVRAGVDGCLITDLSVEEAEEPVARLRAAGLDTVFLAAPTSPPRRLELVSRYSTGFVYLVSRTGVTGERDQLSESVKPLINAMRAITRLPLAVGFGISKAEQSDAAGRMADAIVVGSAFVRAIEQDGPNGEARVEQLARTLKAPLERPL